jgi:6-phosphogluconolactonase (cycloisomerase 2 family)
MYKTTTFLRAGRLALGAITLTIVAAAANAAGDNGGVFVLTNEAAGNKVATYSRASNGALTFLNSVATGGLGSGAGLGSQGAVQLSADGQWLLAVNAGSNDLSVFAIKQQGLALVDRVSSGGTDPISVTIHGNLVYVLNAGGSQNIAGFSLSNNGHLSWMSGSNRALSSTGVGPAQIQFSPDGDLLVVTEKATSKLDVYSIEDNGYVQSQTVQNSAGSTPFGFSFSKRDRLFVSEAGPSAISSYATWDDGTILPISPTVATMQAAACWVAVTPNGKFAYTANAGSGSITGYAIHPDGSLRILNANGQTGIVGPGSTVLDMAISVNGHYLYVIARGYGAVHGFSIGADGSLKSIGEVGGLPTSSTSGIAAW